MSTPAARHDFLNAEVIKALQGVSEQLGETRKQMASEIASLRTEWNARAEAMASYQRVTMQHSDRIVSLETSVRDVQRHMNDLATVAKEGAARRRTDSRVALVVQAVIGLSLSAALSSVAVAIWRIATIMVEAWAR